LRGPGTGPGCSREKPGAGAREIRRGARPSEGARVAPSALSIPPLRPLPAFDGGPIHQVVYLGPYSVHPMGDLILGRASHLDAFSAYRDRTTATERCPGRDNSYTGGPSAPVLSY
jgi:hypothetical protein